MPDCVDLEARERIAELSSEVRQHSMDYWGPDKQNGKRSQIDDLNERVSGVEVRLSHHLDTRASTCLGICALEEFKATFDREGIDVKVAKINRGGTLAMQWIQLVALVAVALIGLLK